MAWRAGVRDNSFPRWLPIPKTPNQPKTGNLNPSLPVPRGGEGRAVQITQPPTSPKLEPSSWFFLLFFWSDFTDFPCLAHTIIRFFPAPKVIGRCGHWISLHVAYFSSPFLIKQAHTDRVSNCPSSKLSGIFSLTTGTPRSRSSWGILSISEQLGMGPVRVSHTSCALKASQEKGNKTAQARAQRF